VHRRIGCLEYVCVRCQVVGSTYERSHVANSLYAQPERLDHLTDFDIVPLVSLSHQISEHYIPLNSILFATTAIRSKYNPRTRNTKSPLCTVSAQLVSLAMLIYLRTGGGWGGDSVSRWLVICSDLMPEEELLHWFIVRGIWFLLWCSLIDLICIQAFCAVA
jgi:hypothetical protein